MKLHECVRSVTLDVDQKRSQIDFGSTFGGMVIPAGYAVGQLMIVTAMDHGVRFEQITLPNSGAIRYNVVDQ